VDHVRDGLQWRVVTVEAPDAENGVVVALRGVEQARGVVPRVVADLPDNPEADKLVRSLLEHGANPNARDNSYQTPCIS